MVTAEVKVIIAIFLLPNVSVQDWQSDGCVLYNTYMTTGLIRLTGEWAACLIELEFGNVPKVKGLVSARLKLDISSKLR